jgi:hypothetical protein
MSCKKHKSNIKGYKDMAILARDLADLKYDSLAVLLEELTKCLYIDSVSDGNRGRGKLQETLALTANYTGLSSVKMKDAWKICEPYMREDKK